MNTPSPNLDPLLRTSLKNQYRAAISMLRQTVDRCPSSLWLAGEPPFWQVAYHTAFYTHLYLMPAESDFQPWPATRPEYHYLGTLPWPPHRPPTLGDPYTQPEILDYLTTLANLISPAIDRLDLTSPASGFPWYQLPKLEHQLMNLRHLQHHTGTLSSRLRAAATSLDWIATA